MSKSVTLVCKTIGQIRTNHKNEIQINLIEVDKEILLEQLHESFTLKEMLEDIDMEQIFEVYGVQELTEKLKEDYEAERDYHLSNRERF